MQKSLSLTITLLLATAFLLSAQTSAKADFYVVPTGNDANDGSRQTPFATPARAQQAVRSLITKGLTKDVTVVLRGGTYFLDKPLLFGPQDSGTQNHAVVYAAHPGEKPVLSGGRIIRGWKKSADNKWILTLPDVKAGKWSFRQLFADGKRLARARHPNAEGLLHIASVSKDVKTMGFKEKLGFPNLAGQDAELIVIQNWSISRAPHRLIRQ